jgi:hypothetical protein
MGKIMTKSFRSLEFAFAKAYTGCLLYAAGEIILVWSLKDVALHKSTTGMRTDDLTIRRSI